MLAEKQLNHPLSPPPPAPKICEILLLNLDSNIIQEMRMYSFIKVKGF